MGIVVVACGSTDESRRADIYGGPGDAGIGGESAGAGGAAGAASDSGEVSDSGEASDSGEVSVSGEASDSGEATDGGDCMNASALTAAVLRQGVEELSGATTITLGGMSVTINERKSQQGRDNAVAYMRQRYEALGLTLNSHPFSGGQNFSVDIPGADGKFVVVSAHYDTVAAPGADDDATGVIAGLAVVSALHKCQLTTGIRVVGFDLEERGNLGSKAYVRALALKDSIVGAFQLEMLGYKSKSDGVFTLVHCDRPESQFLSEALSAAVIRDGLELTPDPVCTEKSDHSSFWNVGVPAIALSQHFFGSNPNGNPCYHKACDTSAKLNFAYMATLTRMTTLAVAELTGAK